MSEFKYACPVCGQHIRCDSTQSGSEMECPTCLQKIIAPQAPGADQKFILSGKKAGDRPKTSIHSAPVPVVEPVHRSFPVAAIALTVLVVFGAAVLILFHGKIFKFDRGSNPPAATVQNQTGSKPEKPAVPPPPPVVIPHANETNWMLNLDAASFPETPAAGRLHGQDFLCERAYLQNGSLTLREGTKGSADFAMVINFSGAQGEALAGKTINVTTNAPLAARITLRWKETDQALKDNFETGYALRLELGPLAKNHIPGKIYFCAPDDAKSYVAGTFNAEIRKPKAAKPK